MKKLESVQDALAIDSKYAEAYRLMGIDTVADEKEAGSVPKFCQGKGIG